MALYNKAIASNLQNPLAQPIRVAKRYKVVQMLIEALSVDSVQINIVKKVLI